MKRYGDIAIGTLVIMILVMYIFGAAASLTVPFSYTQVSFASAAASLQELSPGTAFGDRLFWLVPVLLAPVLVFLLSRRKRTRLTCIAISFLLPLLILDPSRAIAQFVFIPFITPSTTIGMFTGSLDGETWSEGFVSLAAMGWWIVLWMVAFVIELRKANKFLHHTNEIARDSI